MNAGEKVINEEKKWKGYREKRIKDVFLSPQNLEPLSSSLKDLGPIILALYGGYR